MCKQNFLELLRRMYMYAVYDKLHSFVMLAHAVVCINIK